MIQCLEKTSTKLAISTDLEQIQETLEEIGFPYEEYLELEGYRELLRIQNIRCSKKINYYD